MEGDGAAGADFGGAGCDGEADLQMFVRTVQVLMSRIGVVLRLTWPAMEAPQMMGLLRLSLRTTAAMQPT